MSSLVEPMEPKPVAKVQKTVLIPEDLYRLIAHIEKTTGASFTRISIAALLQYLFTDPHGPNPHWMEYVVSLELGEITVGDLPTQRMNDIAADEVGRLGSTEVPPDGSVKEVDPAYGELYQAWQEISVMPCKDPLDKIMFNWGIIRKR